MDSDPDGVEDVLRGLGVPEDLIADAISRGDPVSAFFESLPLRALEDRTVSAADIEAGGGMPAAQVQELMQAFGLRAADAGEPGFTPAEARAFTELWRQRDVWPFELAIQIGRLYGRLLARIAQASVQQWFVVAAPRLRAAEQDEREQTIAAAETFERLLPVAEELLVAVHRRWVEREAAQTAIRNAESHRAAPLLSTGSEVSILFCDLKDFTAFADRQGDGAAVRIIDQLAGTVTRERGEGAQLTKLLGDGFMLVYSDPAPAVDAATRIMEAMRAPGQPGIHASIHHGHAIPREGDYFGSAVNLAARLLTLAEENELLATEPVVERCPDHAWERCGSENVRGVADQVQVFRLKR